MKSQSLYSNKEIIRIANDVSANLDIPVHIVLLVYKSYWDNIKEHIANLDVDGIIDNDIIKPVSFNVPSLGKLYLNPNKAVKINIRKLNREKNKFKIDNPNRE